MSTLLKCNAVFLHVPKTGGTFLRRLFIAMDLIRFDFARDHSDMERTVHVRAHYPGNFYKRSLQLGGNLEKRICPCYKFCFVRNPYSWYESYWRFMRDKNWRSYTQSSNRTRFGFYYDTWHPLTKIEKLLDPDFNRFMENVILQAPGFLTEMFGLYAVDGQIDFTGKQETLEEDIKTIFRKLDVRYDETLFGKVGAVNESLSPKPQWDPGNREMIAKLEEEIFRLYGYDAG